MRNNSGVQLNIIKFQKMNQSGLGKTGNEYIGATISFQFCDSHFVLITTLQEISHTHTSHFSE